MGCCKSKEKDTNNSLVDKQVVISDEIEIIPTKSPEFRIPKRRKRKRRKKNINYNKYGKPIIMF